jgi:ABC-type branched-subunit amino acid transport system ATPase component
MRSSAQAPAAAASPRNVLDVERLSVAYGKVLAVRDVSLHVAPGTIVTVIGPNGAGKTTLLAAIAGAGAREARAVRVDERCGQSPARRICTAPRARR